MHSVLGGTGVLGSCDPSCGPLQEQQVLLINEPPLLPPIVCVCTHACMWVHVCECLYGATHHEASDDNFWESVFFYRVGPSD